ncbi:tetratricopeptide repeat protein [Streptomyces sp. NBC_01750]|uniref:tetratricopeptide repeat protein n=1 Tax=Streptomyces sp. NBC_01750 TaxID=2975928 RepID=UPI002DDB991E|nr:tetratricopeptide repeat protein [Streptomyces sp. NBC_01750]WSD36944.1 tetratricopeptide repeat protein [Streptomyces sp. NBC_01750]
MYGKAFAPEYQGELGSVLGVNSSYDEVLATATHARRHAVSALDRARASLAVAEAGRRLGRVAEAGASWRDSYRAARQAGDRGAMAWALWSGGTLARQCGALPLARRLLAAAVDLAVEGGDRLAHGYSLAGLAETGRIQGDYEAVAEMHEQLLAQARAHGESRHMVWAMSGIAQMHRNTGACDKALALFEECARIADDADDARGRAWSLRGIADVVSVQGDTERALTLLAEAATICRDMELAGALAYNHKMRGNVLFRAARYEEACAVYSRSLREFRDMNEPRGAALSRLGLVKSRSRQGRAPDATLAELAELETEFKRIGLRHARQTVIAFRDELAGVHRNTDPSPAHLPSAGTIS